MTDTPPSSPAGPGKAVALAVLLTTLFWTVVWGGVTLARGRPQPVAFAVQPPPATATATPSPTWAPVVATPSPVATQAPSATAASGETDAPDVSRGAVVPVTSQETPPASPTGADRAGAASLININTATAVELEALPGIGPKTAEAIVDYRQEHGPFVTPESITDVPGIGPATLEDIRALITTQ